MSIQDLMNILSIGIGLLIVIIGLIYKKKNWAKWVILLGVVAMIAGLFQLFLF
jgi:hypothetical protein